MNKEVSKPRQLTGYVGFANLPNQVYRRAVKNGFEFTLMVVGESGLGKSTFINSLFLTEIYNSTDYPGPTQRLKKTVSIETTKIMLKENGVKLLLTMVDTPGYGDAIDNTNCWVPIIEYVESKYEEYLNSEMRVTRKMSQDQRVHCCLYFIRPTGHGMKSLDIEFLKKVCDKVNVIPVIAKADTLTSEECAVFKKQILREMADNKIKIYEFPDIPEEDEEYKLNKSLKERVPFAVVGSNVVVEVNGKKLRGRRYPWGVAEVENLDHCDFLALRNMLVRTHLQDLKDVTHYIHYENYRSERIAGFSQDGNEAIISNKMPLVEIDQEKLVREVNIRHLENKMKMLDSNFPGRQRNLQNREVELTKQHQTAQYVLEQDRRILEERRKKFELEKNAWEKDFSHRK